MKKAKVFRTQAQVDAYVETLDGKDQAWWPVHYTETYRNYYQSRYNVELTLAWGWFVRSVADDNAVIDRS